MVDGQEVPTDMYLITQALERAAGAGVQIQIVADDDDYSPAGSALKVLDQVPNISVYYCVDGCFQQQAEVHTQTQDTREHVQHNKFMSIDRVLLQPRLITPAQGAGSTTYMPDIVLQMTSNWTNEMLSSHNFNSAVEFVRDQDMWVDYNAYWDALKTCATKTAHSCQSWPSSSLDFTTSSGRAVTVLPRQAGDPILSELGNITCPSEVDVVNNTWPGKHDTNDSRGRDIEQALLALTDPTQQLVPCDVRIVVERKDGNIASDLHDDFGPSAHCTSIQNPAGGADVAVTPAMHSKYILVDGTYNGTAGSMVFTGSETFSTPALLGNDNLWMNLEGAPGDPGTFNAYLNNFNDIFASTTPC